MDNRFYFGFNTSEERKKRRKAELYSMSEQVSTFFWDEAPQHGLENGEDVPEWLKNGDYEFEYNIIRSLVSR